MRVRPLVLTAWLTAGLHVLGIAVAASLMRKGTPLEPTGARVAYLASGSLGWSLGWGVWMLCALSLLAFLAALNQYRPSGTLAPLALSLAAAGAAVDLLCDTLQIVLLPRIAHVGPTLVFLQVERALDAAGLVVANGLYSLAILLLTLSLRGHKGLAAAGRWLGYGTFGAGMLMVVAGFTGDARQGAASSVVTIALFVSWSLVISHALEPRDRPGR